MYIRLTTMGELEYRFARPGKKSVLHISCKACPCGVEVHKKVVVKHMEEENSLDKGDVKKSIATQDFHRSKNYGLNASQLFPEAYKQYRKDNFIDEESSLQDDNSEVDDAAIDEEEEDGEGHEAAMDEEEEDDEGRDEEPQRKKRKTDEAPVLAEAMSSTPEMQFLPMPGCSGQSLMRVCNITMTNLLASGLLDWNRQWLPGLSIAMCQDALVGACPEGIQRDALVARLQRGATSSNRGLPASEIESQPSRIGFPSSAPASEIESKPPSLPSTKLGKIIVSLREVALKSKDQEYKLTHADGTHKGKHEWDFEYDESLDLTDYRKLLKARGKQPVTIDAYAQGVQMMHSLFHIDKPDNFDNIDVMVALEERSRIEEEEKEKEERKK